MTNADIVCGLVSERNKTMNSSKIWIMPDQDQFIGCGFLQLCMCKLYGTVYSIRKFSPVYIV